MNEFDNNDDISEEFKQIRTESNNSFYKNIPSIKLPYNFKISNKKDINNKICQSQNNSNNKIKNMNYLEIETLLKNTNKTALKKYSNDLDKKIKYLKFMNSQKYLQNNNNTSTNSINNKNYVSENDISKTHVTGESTYDNSENRNYIHTEFENSKILKQKNEKIYEEIIKKNIPNHVYYKYRSKNMYFKLKKNNEKTIKNTLETIHSKEDINLNYTKFENTFLIINDSISFSTNMKIKNTNNSFLKFLSFLNNDEILHLFLVNREIRSCIIGCLAYKVKEKILPVFNLKYCKDQIFNNDYNFMILAKPYKKKKIHIRFILSIKPKITKLNQNIINKRIKIGFSEFINNKYNNDKYKEKDKIKVNTSYIFEIIEKLYPKNFWVFRENTSFHFDESNKAYYNDIMQFWPGDKALININLISEIGIIDFDNFLWSEQKIIEIKNKNNLTSIDKCEVEYIINEWNKLSLLENCNVVEKNINDLFGKNFIIKEINYDDVGYFFFKIILKAYKVGNCRGKEGNLGIKINILPINSNITNEIKKNGLIFDENNELTVNVGDIITFYISQNKNI